MRLVGNKSNLGEHEAVTNTGAVPNLNYIPIAWAGGGRRKEHTAKDRGREEGTEADGT